MRGYEVDEMVAAHCREVSMETKTEEWRGIKRCEICRVLVERDDTFPDPYIHWHNGIKCHGTLIPYERRKPTRDVAELVGALEDMVTDYDMREFGPEYVQSYTHAEKSRAVLAKHGQERKV